MADELNFVMNTLNIFSPLLFNIYSEFMIAIGITFFVTLSLTYGLKRLYYDINGINYKMIEIIHNNRIKRNIVFTEQDRKYDRNEQEYKLKDGILILRDFVNPLRVGAFGTGLRYSFKNDNVLPNINIDGNPKNDVVKTKIKNEDNEEEIKKDEFLANYTPMNSFEILTYDAKNKLIRITNQFYKHQLEEKFVEKIKKEATHGWEAFLEFLKTPSGAMLILGITALGIFALYTNMPH